MGRLVQKSVPVHGERSHKLEIDLTSYSNGLTDLFIGIRDRKGEYDCLGYIELAEVLKILEGIQDERKRKELNYV